MKYSNNEGLDYIRQFPKLKKWMNTCICCGSTGYNPDLPKELTANWGQGEYTTASARYIRKYFRPMKVNELGMCEICEKQNHTL